MRSVVGTVRASLGTLGEALDAAARERGEAVNRDLALLRSKEVKNLAAKDRSLARRVRDLTEANQRIRDELKALRTEQTAAVTQLGTDLEEFLSLHGG